MAGRNIENGVYESKELNERNFLEQTYHSFQFTSLINYLISLEQVGSIFKSKNRNVSTDKGKENVIYSSLSYYSNLEEDKKRCVVALRNSLTHKFGLSTESNPGSGFPVRFTLSIERNKSVIKVPSNINKWDGDFSNKSEHNLTIVYILDLIDLIENVFNEIANDLSKENIKILVSIEELKARYTFVNE